MDGYFCKECGMAVVILKDGTKLRPCGHSGPIIAGMSATAYSHGSLEQKNGKQPQGSRI